MQHTIFSRVADLYRMHFDVVLRKLVSEFQAGPQRVDKPTVSRFYLTVEFDCTAGGRARLDETTQETVLAAKSLSEAVGQVAFTLALLWRIYSRNRRT